jgi:hypothetical protein
MVLRGFECRKFVQSRRRFGGVEGAAASVGRVTVGFDVSGMSAHLLVSWMRVHCASHAISRCGRYFAPCIFVRYSTIAGTSFSSTGAL